MNFKPRKAPWHAKYKQGTRNNPDPRYHTPAWRRLRQTHIEGTTEVTLMQVLAGVEYLNTFRISNRLCIECFKKGITKAMHTVDHIQRARNGGEFYDLTNLQSLCAHCHAVKSANESNESRL